MRVVVCYADDQHEKTLYGYFPMHTLFIIETFILLRPVLLCVSACDFFSLYSPYKSLQLKLSLICFAGGMFLHSLGRKSTSDDLPLVFIRHFSYFFHFLDFFYFHFTFSLAFFVLAHLLGTIWFFDKLL